MGMGMGITTCNEQFLLRPWIRHQQLLRLSLAPHHHRRRRHHQKNKKSLYYYCTITNTSATITNANAAASQTQTQTQTQTSSNRREGHLLRLLNRSCKAGKFDEGLYFLECMVERGYRPGVVHCTKLINGFSDNQNTSSIRKATRVMELLEQHGTPDTFAYNALLSAFSKHLRTPSSSHQALAILRRMASRACPPDTLTYDLLIRATCSAGVGETVRLLRQMRADGLAPDVDTFNAILRGLSSREDDQGNMLDAALEIARSDAAPNNVVSLNILLRALLKLDRWNDTKKLMSWVRPNATSYSILIGWLCRKGKVEKAVELVEEMLELGIKPDSRCCDPIVSGYCKKGKVDMAVGFLEGERTSSAAGADVVSYNTVVAWLCKSGRVEEAVEVFGGMRCAANTSSYNALIGGLWNGGEKRRALELVSEMMRNGLEPDEVTYNVLISCLCRDGMVDEAMHLKNDLNNNNNIGRGASVITYNALILGLCKAHRISEAIELLAEMVEKKGCAPNQSTYVMLVEGMSYAGHSDEAAEVGNALLSWNVIPKDSLSLYRLNKTFPSSSCNPPHAPL